VDFVLGVDKKPIDLSINIADPEFFEKFEGGMKTAGLLK
jgi:hypothetical protein